jgi:hypothetical protein
MLVDHRSDGWIRESQTQHVAVELDGFVEVAAAVSPEGLDDAVLQIPSPGIRESSVALGNLRER